MSWIKDLEEEYKQQVQTGLLENNNILDALEFRKVIYSVFHRGGRNHHWILSNYHPERFHKSRRMVYKCPVMNQPFSLLARVESLETGFGPAPILSNTPELTRDMIGNIILNHEPNNNPHCIQLFNDGQQECAVEIYLHINCNLPKRRDERRRRYRYCVELITYNSTTGDYCDTFPIHSFEFMPVRDKNFETSTAGVTQNTTNAIEVPVYIPPQSTEEEFTFEEVLSQITSQQDFDLEKWFD